MKKNLFGISTLTLVGLYVLLSVVVLGVCLIIDLPIIYGIIFYVLLEVNQKFLYEGKIVYRIIISFLFVIFISLLYFLMLIKINNGILHLYFFLTMFTGYLLSFVIYKKLIVKINKVWYNSFRKVGDYG